MRTVNYILIIHFLLIANELLSQNDAKRNINKRPSFGVIMNEDGDLAFVSPDPIIAEKMLRANVDGHARLGIKTYVFSVGAGSDVLYYQTKVASEVGWRKTKYEDENATWQHRICSARNCIAAGLDAVRIAGTQAKKNGMMFIPSLRMNDDHFMSDPYNYPLTGKFWLENTKLTIKESPIVFSKDYGNLLNYEHEKVRNYRYSVVIEAIERNKDIIDGFELDFNRVQVFFPKGRADIGAPLMTDLVRKIRCRLDELSEEQNRPMYLFVRIPPSEEACSWAGLDIDTWMKEGLVDLISPSQLMTLAHDMPIKNMTKKAHNYNVLIYPTIYPRTSFRVPLIPSSVDLGMGNDVGRDVTLAEALGAAANYRWMEVDGFYFFNYYGYPHPQYMYEMTAHFNHDIIDTNDKVYVVTKTYYNDDLIPSYAYVKQLPKKIIKFESFKLIVGENLKDLPFSINTCILRIGLKKSINNDIEIKLNGQILKKFIEKNHLEACKGRRLPSDMAEKSLIFPIDSIAIIKQGENIIEINLDKAIITDIELGYSCFNDLRKIMLGGKIPKLNENIKVN